MISKQLLQQCKNAIKARQKITFMIGAGLSAESGIPTFRGKEGYWTIGSKNYMPEEMATQKMFKKCPEELWKWYLYRIAEAEKVKPNIGHLILNKLEKKYPESFHLISQNVDGLHTVAGNSLSHSYFIHGDLSYVRCSNDCTNTLFPFPKELNLRHRTKKTSITAEERSKLSCDRCHAWLRPHVLWFDEYYNEEFFKWESSLKIANETGVLILIGTTGMTNLPQHIFEIAYRNKAQIVEVNPNETHFSSLLKDYPNGEIYSTKGSIFLSELFEALQ
ncbi:MAG: iron dicitrate transport regulator FecR [Flavobacteriales bacterium]|jgi:NAD-dependent deacetylase|nr:iron dicitrate transport regulator FecR [Flavobacteriales bacterium]